MVLLNLSVIDVNEALEFYSSKIGLFSTGVTMTRLVCDSGPKLIIDLYEVRTKEHLDVFEQDTHTKSSFILCYDDNEKLDLINRLKENGVPYEEEDNMMAHSVNLVDPSGNSVSISAGHGVIV